MTDASGCATGGPDPGPAPAGDADQADPAPDMLDLDEISRRDVETELQLEDLALERAFGGLDRVLPPALSDFLG